MPDLVWPGCRSAAKQQPRDCRLISDNLVARALSSMLTRIARQPREKSLGPGTPGNAFLAQLELRPPTLRGAGTPRGALLGTCIFINK